MYARLNIYNSIVYSFLNTYHALILFMLANHALYRSCIYIRLMPYRLNKSCSTVSFNPREPGVLCSHNVFLRLTMVIPVEGSYKANTVITDYIESANDV